MKKFGIISLLSLVLINSIGYYFTFYGDILRAKHEAKILIWGHGHDEKLITLTFPTVNGSPNASGLVFTDDDEFVYQGRMYDISDKSITKGSVSYRCYTDVNETAINNNLCARENTDKSDPTQKHKSGMAIKEFLKYFTVGEKQFWACYNPFTGNNMVYSSPEHIQTSMLFDVLSPPPDLLFS